MRYTRITYFTLTFFLVINLLAATLATAGPVILPTTHYMAANLRLITEDVSATDATAGKITGPMGVPIVFRTFDQFSCNVGKYELVMRIVKADTNAVIATTTPLTVNAPSDGYIHTQPAVWQVLFPAVGWYRYEIVANGAPVAFYYFTVAFNI